MTDPRLLSRKEAARYLGIGVTHFRSCVKPQVPPVPGLGKRELYDRVDLDNLIDRLKGDSSSWVEQCEFK